MTPEEIVAHARTLGLGSRNRHKRERAEAAILAMGDEAVPFLVSVIDEEDRVRKLLRKRIMIGMLCVMIPYIAVGFALVHWFYHSGVGNTIRILMTGVMGSPLLISSILLTPSPVKAHSLRILAGLSDKRSINALVEAYDLADGAAQAEIRSTLTRLLPQLRASDGPLLNDASRTILLSLLHQASFGSYNSPRESAEYVVTIIRCFEQVGDERALTEVCRLAACQELLGAGLPIRLAAQEALPALEKYAESHRIAGTLLRPTVPPDSGAALLRPANSVTSESSLLLLRPTGHSTLE